MSIPLFGLDGMKYLDEQSDRNLVYYFKVELERINKGQFTILTKHDKKRLIECDILSYTHNCRAYNLYLTDKGKRLLNSIELKHKP